jgi:hypothetical protein
MGAWPMVLMCVLGLLSVGLTVRDIARDLRGRL